MLLVVCSVAWSCLTLCDPMDCSLPNSPIHGVSQAGILEWVDISCFRGSSQPRGEPISPAALALTGGFCTTESPGKLSINAVVWHQDVESYVSCWIIDFHSTQLGQRYSLDQFLYSQGAWGSESWKDLSRVPQLVQQSWEQSTFPIPSQSTSPSTTSVSSPPWCVCLSGQSASGLMGFLSTISRWLFLTFLYLGTTFLSLNLKNNALVKLLVFENWLHSDNMWIATDNV